MLAAQPHLRLLVIVPTAHLKAQWARAAATFDLHLDWRWSVADGGLPSDMHGVVTTYQQVASSAAVLRGLAGNAMVIFDELHHAAEDRAWGDALRTAFEIAPRRLALSGTPFRSDTHAIPFIRYQGDERCPTTSTATATHLPTGAWCNPSNGVERPRRQPPRPQLRGPTRGGAGQRAAAHRVFGGRRVGPPRAPPGPRPFAHDPTPPTRRRRVGHISRFTSGSEPWIVAVRMVAEGVDIPRLRVGVFATTTTTELFFRQAVGRLVRWTPGSPGQKSFLFIPDEPHLRARALSIAEHAVTPSATKTGSCATGCRADVSRSRSHYSPRSRPCRSTGAPTRHGWWRARCTGAVADAALTIPLPPVPIAGRDHAGAAADGRTRREHKAHLRRANAETGRLISRHTGLTHAGVNAELNRITGVKKISEATVDQLQRRLDKPDAWLRQASGRLIPPPVWTGRSLHRTGHHARPDGAFRAVVRTC